MKRIALFMSLFIMFVGESWAKDVDILTKIHTVFEGEYTKEQIKAILDETLTLYDSPINEKDNDKNYEVFASVAVSLRKKFGVREMDILACTNQLGKGENAVKLEFTVAAALCVTTIQMEQKSSHTAQFPKEKAIFSITFPQDYTIKLTCTISI